MFAFLCGNNWKREERKSCECDTHEGARRLPGHTQSTTPPPPPKKHTEQHTLNKSTLTRDYFFHVTQQKKTEDIWRTQPTQTQIEKERERETHKPQYKKLTDLESWHGPVNWKRNILM
jgi:hypothetical protein